MKIIHLSVSHDKDTRITFFYFTIIHSNLQYHWVVFEQVISKWWQVVGGCLPHKCQWDLIQNQLALL